MSQNIYSKHVRSLDSLCCLRLKMIILPVLLCPGYFQCYWSSPAVRMRTLSRTISVTPAGAGRRWGGSRWSVWLSDSLLKVLRHQKSLGVTGITTVLGPPVHTFPPLFRQTGPYQGDYITVQYSTLQYITLPGRLLHQQAGQASLQVQHGRGGELWEDLLIWQWAPL